MKGFSAKRLMLVLFIGAMLFSLPVLGQQKKAGSDVVSVDFAGIADFPSDSAMNDIYGTIPGIKLGVTYWINKGVGPGSLGLGGELQFLYGTGKPIGAEDIEAYAAYYGYDISIDDYLTVFPILGNVYYRFKVPNQPKLKPYAGAGLGYYMFTETVKVTGDISDSESTSLNDFGFHFLGGVQYSWGFAELRYILVNLSDSEGAANDFNGLQFLLGARF